MKSKLQGFFIPSRTGSHLPPSQPGTTRRTGLLSPRWEAGAADTAATRLRQPEGTLQVFYSMLPQTSQ